MHMKSRSQGRLLSGAAISHHPHSAHTANIFSKENKRAPNPLTHPKTKSQFTTCRNSLSLTFPCNAHTTSIVEQNTVHTMTCSSITAHSLSCLHAKNLSERTTKMHYKQV